MTQASLAALCWVAYAWPRSPSNRVIWRSSAVWFLIQTVDELWGGNFFAEENAWREYVLLAVLAAGTFIYIRRHEPEETEGKGAG